MSFGREPHCVGQRTALIVLLTVGVALPARARPQSPARAEEPPTFAAGTAAVLLDVVIRDKKGRPVTDIRPEEVEVIEDGLPQKVDSFRWVETEPVRVEGASVPDRPDPSRQVNLVSIVFDQLGIEGRKLAARAATSFLERALRPNTFVAVFSIDQRLALLQPFTGDAGKLNAAVAAATSGTQKGITDEQAAFAKAQSDLEAEIAKSGGDSVLSSPASGPAAAGGNYAGRAQAQALANMIRLSNTLQRQQQGQTSLYPLLALIRGHETLAGRKSLVYLSEGLQVPPNLEQVFRSTIGAANRANVSVYAIDARGLNAENDLAAAGSALTEARRASQRAQEIRNSGANSVSKEEVMMHETAESALRLNVKGTLADFAEGTGGFLVANTNDFKKGAEQLAHDLSGYYEVSYTPPPAPYDGRFRAVEVKVHRKGVNVQNRSGYFALPPGQSAAMFAYEVPLLAALEQKALPREFDLRAAALHFATGPEGREHRLIVEVPISSLKMVTDEVNKSYRVHFSVLAVVRDAAGTVVERFSEDYPFTGPLEKAEALKLGHVVLKRRFSLPPGRYDLEVAGQDREQGKRSVSRARFEVPPASAGPSMSSLAFIRRVEPSPAATETSDDPLDVGGVRVVPNLDAPISAAANQKLSLFFVAYPPAGGEKPRMTLEFWREGKALARAQPELPTPEADGRIRYVGTFPIASFSPGQYEVRVALAAASGSCEERSGFTIVP
jgi:VWFA-related protein